MKSETPWWTRMEHFHIIVFINSEPNDNLQSLIIVVVIIYHNFRVSFEIHVSSITHFIADKRPKASPMSTSSMGTCHSVLAITKFPPTSQIQASKPTLLSDAEKDASTLHLNLSPTGLVHLAVSLCILFKGPQIPYFLCVLPNYSKKVSAWSTICWIVSTTLFQTLLVLCIHIYICSIT